MIDLRWSSGESSVWSGDEVDLTAMSSSKGDSSSGEIDLCSRSGESSDWSGDEVDLTAHSRVCSADPCSADPWGWFEEDPLLDEVAVREQPEPPLTPKARVSIAPRAPRKRAAPARARRVKHRDRRTDWLDADWRGVLAYVYIMTNDNNEAYTGSTRSLRNRLKKHNKGRTKSTRRLIQWRFAKTFGPFCNPTAALRFESLVKKARGRGVVPKIAAADAAFRQL
jgi:predicted GIY-YIG superfamily endonuclease